METLAKEIRKKTDEICVSYHLYKDGDVINQAKKLSVKIQQFCAHFLQGNIFGMEEDAYLDLQSYVVQVLEDYIEAIRQRDTILMLDTLDYGLRELFNIYIDSGEQTHE